MRNFFYTSLSLLSSGGNLLYQNRLRVLAYHAVPDKNKFEKHLLYLKRNFNVISLNELKDHFSQKKGLPAKAVMITFDDGDVSVLENGLPLLKKYKLPATLFVVTGLINSNIPFWWDEIEYYLGSIEGNKKVWEVKDWTNADRENYLLTLREKNSKKPLKARQLTSSELELLAKNDIAIANHSHSHPMFNRCTEAELELELERSASFLASQNFEENIFAYPNGNFSKHSETVLKEKGIELAFLFDHKINEENINPLRISRIRVDADLNLKEFKGKISGVHSLLMHRMKKGKLIHD